MLLDALKKVKKNVRRVFSSPEDAADALDLYRILSTPGMKSMFDLFSSIDASNTFYISAEDHEASDLMADVLNDLEVSLSDAYSTINQEATELVTILSNPHIRALGDCLREIATQNFFTPTLPSSGLFAVDGTITNLPQTIYNDTLQGVSNRRINLLNPRSGSLSSYSMLDGAPKLTGGGEGLALKPVDDGELRLISFKKNPDESLGITVGLQEGGSTVAYARGIYVKRVMAGSRVEKLGLLGEGDIIREINGVSVDSPETLQEQMAKSPPTVTMKIIPAYKTSKVKTQLYVRALFSYEPEKDKLLPCKEAGLRFQCYDILQILNQSDQNWWQARRYESNERAALIPSNDLQERRKALIQSIPDANAFNYRFFKGLVNNQKTKKVKLVFRAKDFEAFASKDVRVYEEVALISGFQRPVVCLLGATGVGRQTLRDMLIQDNPDRYELAIPYTSRTRLPGEEDGDEYFFESARKMQKGYQLNHFIEFGEIDGCFYGTKLKTLRRIAQSGKTCLLDCSPAAVNVIRTSEFMPYVVFLAAPSRNCLKAMYEYGRSLGFIESWTRDDDFREILEESQEIERNYRHIFNKIFICDNIEVTFALLKQHLDNLLVTPQWVPAKWLY